MTQSGRHWPTARPTAVWTGRPIAGVTCDLPVDPVGPVAGAHGGVAGGVLAGDVGALRVGVEDEQRLVVAADTLGRHVFPLGADLQHTRVWSESAYHTHVQAGVILNGR